MELRLYLAILWQRRLPIAAATGVGLIVGALATMLMPPRYQAQAMLRVPTPLVGSLDSTYYDLNFAGRLMSTYAEEASGPGMAALLAEELGYPPRITAEVIGNTELMAFTAEGPDPQLVTRAANFVAGHFVERRGAAPGPLPAPPRPLEELESAAANTIIAPAVVPTRPVSPRMLPNLVLGLLGGLIAGIALAFFRENLDRRLYTSEQIAETTGHTPLIHIPAARALGSPGYLNGTTPQSEAFRQLRTHLLTYGQAQTLRTLLVTSAQAGEGKTTTVASLAVAFGQAGHTVVAVDCDLRNPALHLAFGLPNTTGLSDVLEGTASLDTALQGHPTIGGLAVLTSGHRPAHPTELVTPGRLKELLGQLAARFQLVLFDGPALSVADALILAAELDGVILVVGRGQARVEAVAVAREQLATLRPQPLWIVDNQVRTAPHAFGGPRSQKVRIGAP